MEYVFANSDGLVLTHTDGGRVMLRRGDAWFADDPFVLAHREMFSATPLVVHSTIGRPTPDPTPVTDAPAPGKARARV